MKYNKLFVACAAVAFAMSSSMVKADEPLFMRSSIYSILVNSEDQNTRLDKEAIETDENGYQEAIASLGGGSLGSLPKLVFSLIQIPEQFNDHNLSIRVIDFDEITKNISEDQAKAARPKGVGAANLAKALGGAALSAAGGNDESSILRAEKVDDYMHAAVQKFLADEKVADYMVAKWYDYNPDNNPKFSAALISSRGLDNASAADLAKAAANDELKAALSAQGFDLLNNTFVVATNLRFRNNKAVAKEISDIAANAAAAAGSHFGGSLGGAVAGLGAKYGTEALVNKIMKDQFSVTAVTHLYKLDWNDEIDEALGEKVLYNENATLQDLLDSGLCKLTYVGQTKARAGVKKDKKKTLDQLTSSATARAIDAALAKLQVENEVFRTKVPVSKCEDGFIYAKIGTKEGVAPGDEYEILEMQFDKNTNRNVFKKVGKAVVDKGGVWFNTTGADEIIANADDKEAEKLKAAQELGYTKFKAGKKDFSGYYLRLAKKKGKIED